MTDKSDRAQSVAVVVGCEGQDGYYLTKLLEGQGATVIGVGRNRIVDGRPAPRERSEITEFIRELEPNAVYYLAAHHRAAQDVPAKPYDEFAGCSEAHIQGLAKYLDAISQMSPSTRLFYAGSAHVFGVPKTTPQSEETAFAPSCIYGITKAAGIELCRFYRDQHNIYCSVGILYNHESPRRSSAFVTRKITLGVAAIKRGEQSTLTLGNLDARVDWGASSDYVGAMHQILALDQPDDFIVASGELRSVGEFAENAFAAAGLNHAKYVREDSSLISKPARSGELTGDAQKLRNLTGWRPTKNFQDIVLEMTLADLKANPGS